jgi:uncharacterized protein RhaS with RHS repeats
MEASFWEATLMGLRAELGRIALDQHRPHPPSRRWLRSGGRQLRRLPTDRRRHKRAPVVHRYYDPTTGQFLTVDPLVDQTEQPFAYAAGDPVAGLDLNGLGDPESNLEAMMSAGAVGEDTAEAQIKSGGLYPGDTEQIQEARAKALSLNRIYTSATNRLNRALTNPGRYSGKSYDYVYRSLTRAARRANWDVNIARNGRGVAIVKPGTTQQIRIMAPSPGAPAGSPPSFYRIVIGKLHINLEP